MYLLVFVKMLISGVILLWQGNISLLSFALCLGILCIVGRGPCINERICILQLLDGMFSRCELALFGSLYRSVLCFDFCLVDLHIDESWDLKSTYHYNLCLLLAPITSVSNNRVAWRCMRIHLLQSHLPVEFIWNPNIMHSFFSLLPYFVWKLMFSMFISIFVVAFCKSYFLYKVKKADIFNHTD